MHPPASRIPTYCACSIRYAHGKCAKGVCVECEEALGSTSGLALLRRAAMPLRVGVMRAAEPLAAALAILLSAFAAGFIHARDSLTGLFLGLYGCSRHGFLLGERGTDWKAVSGQVSDR